MSLQVNTTVTLHNLHELQALYERVIAEGVEWNLDGRSPNFLYRAPTTARIKTLLRNIPRVASIRTLTPCVLLSLQRDSLFDLLAKAPQVRARLEQAVLERLPAQDLPHAGKVAPKAAHLLSATEPR